MHNDLSKKGSKQALRHYVLVMAFAVMGIVLIATMRYFLTDEGLDQKSMTTSTSPNATSSSAVRSAPVRLQIPTLKIDTSFVEPLGLNPDNTLLVPDSFTQVGWYKNGATPGEIGPAVVLGHVDSKTGPAVFYSLGQLRIGDTIEITREDGVVIVFAVEKLERYPQDSFPTELVYGKTMEPTLRLVTCSGTFNRGKQEYSHNLVVFATLKSL